MPRKSYLSRAREISDYSRSDGKKTGYMRVPTPGWVGWAVGWAVTGSSPAEGCFLVAGSVSG